MPIIEAHILHGYDQGVRTRLAHGLTDAMRLVIPAPPESITVVVRELQAENYMRGGAIRRRGVALPDAAELVRRFHVALTSGDFATAGACLTEDCVIILPGGTRVADPGEIAAFTAGRWSDVVMHPEGADVCAGPVGPIVYLRTRVSGELRDGTRRENMRATQRFEFRGPLIARIEAMSDLSNHL